MIKNDRWIAEKQGMITPFESSCVSSIKENPVISYGLSSFGYDLRLSPNEFLIFKRCNCNIFSRLLMALGLQKLKPIDPKNFDASSLESLELQSDETGDYFVMPPYSYGLGVSIERIVMPPSVTAICVGKSTLARVGIIANITPIEAGWCGYVTLEFNNPLAFPVKLYAEGVVQLIFHEGDLPETTYADRNGKYQNQIDRVTLPR